VGDLTAAGCTEDLNLVSVLTPDAQVDYALGGVFDQNGIDVDAYAQAGIFSPGKIAPFFIPWGCSSPSLPSQIFVKAGSASTPTEPTPTFKTPMLGKNGSPSVDTVVPAEVAFGPTANTRTISGVNMGANATTLTAPSGTFSATDAGAQIKVIGAAARGVTGVTMALGSPVLTAAAGSNFSAADVNADIRVVGGGAAGDLVTKILTVDNPTQVTLAAPAGTAVAGGTAGITPSSGPDLVTTIAAVPPNQTEAVTLAKPAASNVTNGTASVTTPSSLRVEVTGDGFSDNTSVSDPALEVWFVRGPEAYSAIATGTDVVLDKYKNPKRDSATVTVPAAVLDQSASAWYIQVRNLVPASNYSFSEAKTNVAILRVSSSSASVDKCGVRATGDFGLLNSPRSDTNQLQARLDLNIAEGLDHGVQVFPNALTSEIDLNAKDNCRITPQQPITNGVLDDDATVTAGGIPNCLEINNGNKVDATTDGLIKGGTNPRAFDGRLEAPPSTGCRPARSALGVNINDDVLTCFMTSGSIQGAISGADPKFMSEIVDSPRFMFVPVLYSSINPQNGFYPIQRFVGAFITEQEPTAVAESTLSNNEPVNGVVVGAQKVEGINVIPFELDRLPEQIDYAGQVIPYIGAGPKVVRLIK
jgi:hypothetical protein